MFINENHPHCLAILLLQYVNALAVKKLHFIWCFICNYYRAIYGFNCFTADPHRFPIVGYTGIVLLPVWASNVGMLALPVWANEILLYATFDVIQEHVLFHSYYLRLNITVTCTNILPPFIHFIISTMHNGSALQRHLRYVPPILFVSLIIELELFSNKVPVDLLHELWTSHGQLCRFILVLIFFRRQNHSLGLVMIGAFYAGLAQGNLKVMIDTIVSHNRGSTEPTSNVLFYSVPLCWML